MSDIILDGTGKGHQAKVNSNNELLVHATSVTMQDVSFSDGRAFSCYLKRNIATGGGSNETLGRLEYTGTDLLFVSQIIVSTNGAVSNVEFFYDSTSVSGGDAYTALNSNRGSSVASDTSILTGSSTITETLSDALEFGNTRLNNTATSTIIYNLEGSIILTKGKSISIVGTSGTTGDKLRAQIFWFEGSGL